MRKKPEPLEYVPAGWWDRHPWGFDHIGKPDLRGIGGSMKKRKARPHLRPDGIPTRCDRRLMSAAERAILRAMAAVEKAGASPALTEAVDLLAWARNRVADHVEGKR